MRPTIGKKLRIVASFLLCIQQITIAPFPALAADDAQLELTSDGSVTASTPYSANTSSQEEPVQQNQLEPTFDFLTDTTWLELSDEEIIGAGAGLSGADGNGDGVVDAGDYIVYRKLQGSTSPDSPGDFNRDGIVNDADYQFWRSRFGTTVTNTFGAVNAFEWINSQHDSITGTFEMIPGAPVSTYTYLLVDPPDHGTLQINGADYTYTPFAGYYGNDSFSFQVKNSAGTYSYVATGQILGLYGLGQTVAVIDSGVDYYHQSLGGGLGLNYRVVGGWDFKENDANPLDDQVGLNGHGTHVTGIIASDHPTYTGVAPLVDIVSLRVFSDTGVNWSTDTENALMWILDRLLDENGGTSPFENPITTINMSITYGGNYAPGSGPTWSSLFDSFMNMIKGEGVFISTAAGNCFNLGTSCTTTYGTPGLTYPASSVHVVPVMSTNDWTTGSLTGFSQRHSTAIAADGFDIMSTVPDWRGNNNGVHTDFRSMSGTSMASPFIAGAAILIREAFNHFGNTNNINESIINQHMRNTADSFFDPATSANYLRLNLDRALDSIFNPQNYSSAISNYLNSAGIIYGLGSGSGAGAGAGAGASLVFLVEELLTPSVKAPAGFFEQMTSRQPAHFTYQPAPIGMVAGLSENDESEAAKPVFSKTEKNAAKPNRLEETTLNDLPFESWDFESMKNVAFSSNPTPSNAMTELSLPNDLKGELVGDMLWVRDKTGNLVARIALPAWVLFAIKSNPDLASYYATLS